MRWRHSLSILIFTLTSFSLGGAARTVASQSEVPSGGAFPAIDHLLGAVQKNQKTIDAIRENYTYTKVEEDTDLDNQGRVKNKTSREYEVFYVNGWEVQKLVEKNGQRLSPVEQQKEEKRVKKEVLKYTSADSKAAVHSQRQEQEEDELHISTFLRAARFTHPRRERFRDQETIALDLEPNPAYHPQNLNERLVQKLQGVMWVDERAHQVVRLEARLSNGAKIGGGLLGSIQSGSAAVFEQALINNEVWLPSYLEEHLSGRYLMFKSYREDFVIHYKEYKRFRVDVETNSGVPSPNDGGKVRP